MSDRKLSVKNSLKTNLKKQNRMKPKKNYFMHVICHDFQLRNVIIGCKHQSRQLYPRQQHQRL